MKADWIRSIDVLSEMHELRFLYLAGNPIEDDSAIYQLEHITPEFTKEEP